MPTGSARAPVYANQREIVQGKGAPVACGAEVAHARACRQFLSDAAAASARLVPRARCAVATACVVSGRRQRRVAGPAECGGGTRRSAILASSLPQEESGLIWRFVDGADLREEGLGLPSHALHLPRPPRFRGVCRCIYICATRRIAYAVRDLVLVIGAQSSIWGLPQRWKALLCAKCPFLTCPDCSLL